MGFVPTSIRNKATFQSRPAVPSNKQLKSAEWVQLMDLIDTNYQELLDLVAVVAGLSPLPYVRFDADFNITNAGIYVFFGSTGRTVTIDDAIDGLVEIRTVANADLTISGNLNANHLGTIYTGSAVTSLRWDSVDLEYTF